MRTIKFRAKRKEDGKWIYGNYIVTKHHITGEELHRIVGVESGNDVIDEKTLGQFTGLYDKNGNEIYQGDILNMRKRYLKKNNQIFKSTGEVYLEEEVFRCDQITLAYLNLDDLEIIGNIYENPELLEK